MCPLLLVLILLVLYVFLDINAYLRLIYTIVMAYLFPGSRKKLLDSTIMHGLCTTQDLNLFLKNMNDARYLREADFAMVNFYATKGLFSNIYLKKGVAQAACSVRYRRAITRFSFYKIVTKLVYWDDKNMYFEHQFITLNDGFVRSVVYAKQNVFRTDVNQMVSELLEPGTTKPEPTPDLQHWLASIEAASQRFRKSD